MKQPETQSHGDLPTILLPKFPKEYCNIIKQIGEYAAHKIQIALKQYLRFNIEVLWHGMDSLLFGKFIELIQSDGHACIHILQANNFQHYSLFVQNLVTVSCLMERMLGARYFNKTALIEFTAMETAMVSRLTSFMLTEMEKAFYSIIPVSWKIYRQESNPTLASVIPDKESVIVLNFAIRGQALPGMMRMCIVTTDLTAHLEKHKKNLGVTSAKPQNHSMISLVNKIPTVIAIRLGDIQLSCREVATLSVGDIIRIDRPLAAPVGVYIENSRKFTGKLGKSGDKWACVIEKSMGGKV